MYILYIYILHSVMMSFQLWFGLRRDWSFVSPRNLGTCPGPRTRDHGDTPKTLGWFLLGEIIENPSKIRMKTGGTSILGNHHFLEIHGNPH